MDNKTELPQIVIIGGQSSGKTSTLQSITGLTLPIGVGRVTLCPIIIQLWQGEPEGLEVWGKDPKKKQSGTPDDLAKLVFEAMQELKWEIKEEIFDTPVNVKVTKKDLPDLTLIDMPGMTYI